MIPRLFAGFAWAGFLFWSLLCLGLWGVLALGGDALRWLAGAALDPAAGGAVSTGLNFLEAFGTVLVAWVWLAGTALIAAAGFALRRAAASATTIRVATFRSDDWGPREMKDVTPPAPAPAGDLPRLPPR